MQRGGKEEEETMAVNVRARGQSERLETFTGLDEFSSKNLGLASYGVT